MSAVELRNDPQCGLPGFALAAGTGTGVLQSGA